MKNVFNYIFKEKNIKKIFKNISFNFLFVISAVLYYFLSFPKISLNKVISLSMTFFALVIFVSQIDSIFKYIKSKNKLMKILAFLSSLGVGEYLYFSNINRVKTYSSNSIFIVLLVIGILLSLYFIYTFIIFIYDRLYRLLKNGKAFKNINKSEKIVYSVIFVLTSILIIYSFVGSKILYSSDGGVNNSIYYDIVYTSDTPILMEENVYINLFHEENDLRQPFFALFSIPFTSISYFISYTFGLSNCARAILINLVQVMMILFSVYLLSNLLKLDENKKNIFVLLFCSTYTYLLFSFMMEQYVVAFFWLIVTIYSYCCDNKLDSVYYCGTAGTLLTSGVLVLLNFFKNKKDRIKNFIFDSIVNLCFLGFSFAFFCRLDVLYSFKSKIQSLMRFSGYKLTASDKINQFFDFIHNIFVSPRVKIMENNGFKSWQLLFPKSINLIGILILVFVLLSLYLNRKKKISLISGAWILFSFVILFIFGWGTAENGLILYSLYFSWAYIILIYQLIDWLGDKFKNIYLLPVVSIVLIIGLISSNIPSIMNLIKFIINYY